MQKKISKAEFLVLLPIWLLLSFFSNIGCVYLLNLSASDSFISSLFVKIFVCLFNALFLFLTIRNWQSVSNRKQAIRKIIYSFLFSFPLAMSYILGYQLKTSGMTALGVKGKLLIFIMSLAVGIAFLPFTNLWFTFLDYNKNKRTSAKNASVFPSAVQFFGISFFIIFICWIPAFLAYYPAIMSYDFHTQSIQAYNGWELFNTHHPLIHTLLIRFFFLLGERIGSYQIAMAVFSIIQMLVLSASFAYSCVMLGRLTNRKWPCLISTAFFALVPFHPVLALCVTKDILFTAFFLLSVTLILEYRMANTRKKRIFLFIALSLCGILMLLFRNNAIYAFVIFSFFYIIFSKKQRLQILLLCIIIIAGGYSAKNALKTVIGASEGSGVEKYSVIIQQMACVGQRHMGYLTEDEYYTLVYYIPEYCWDDYNPTIADSVKHDVGLYTFDNCWKGNPNLIRDWIKLGLTYPNDYIDAFLNVSLGYWFIDDMTHAEVLGYGDDSDYGLIYTFNVSASDSFEGIESHSYLPGLLNLYSKIINGNAYQNWPILSILFKPAFYTWILLLCMISVCYLKERNKLVLFLLPFMYYLTLLLGPVVNIRYIYPIIAVTPLFLSWIFSEKNWINIYTPLSKK